MQVDHIGIAVRSIASSLPQWERTLGVVGSPPEEIVSAAAGQSAPAACSR